MEDWKVGIMDGKDWVKGYRVDKGIKDFGLIGRLSVLAHRFFEYF